MRRVGGHHSGDNIDTATDFFHLRPISTLPCGAAWPLWLNFNSLRMSDPMQLNLAPLRAAFDRKVADRCACPLYPPLPFIGFAPLCIHPVLRHTLHALPTMCGKAPSGRGGGPSTNHCAFYPLPPPSTPHHAPTYKSILKPLRACHSLNNVHPLPSTPHHATKRPKVSSSPGGRASPGGGEEAQAQAGGGEEGV